MWIVFTVTTICFRRQRIFILIAQTSITLHALNASAADICRLYTDEPLNLAALCRALKLTPRPARGAVRGPERLRGAPVRVEAREQRLGVARANVRPVQPGTEARGRGVGRVRRA